MFIQELKTKENIPGLYERSHLSKTKINSLLKYMLQKFHLNEERHRHKKEKITRSQLKFTTKILRRIFFTFISGLLGSNDKSLFYISHGKFFFYTMPIFSREPFMMLIHRKIQKFNIYDLPLFLL